MQRAVALRPATARPGIRAARLVPVALAAVTVMAFLPVLGNGFGDWDDTLNFLANPHYRGLGWIQLRWMATESHRGHFVPLAWLTLGLDYVVWGMNPAGYHLALGRLGEAIDPCREGLALAPRRLAVRLSLATALLAAGRLDETVGVLDGARRFHAPATLAQYFEDVVRHKPDAPVPRLGLVRAGRALGERERARAELEVLGRLHPGLASAVVAGGEPS